MGNTGHLLDLYLPFVLNCVQGPEVTVMFPSGRHLWKPIQPGSPREGPVRLHSVTLEADTKLFLFPPCWGKIRNYFVVVVCFPLVKIHLGKFPLMFSFPAAETVHWLRPLVLKVWSLGGQRQHCPGNWVEIQNKPHPRPAKSKSWESLT